MTLFFALGVDNPLTLTCKDGERTEEYRCDLVSYPGCLDPIDTYEVNPKHSLMSCR